MTNVLFDILIDYMIMLNCVIFFLIMFFVRNKTLIKKIDVF
jgi:hypothetical protein